MGLRVERAQGAQVDDLGLDAFFSQLVRRLQGHLQPLGVGDDGDVLAFPLHVGDADGDQESSSSGTSPGLVQCGMFDEEHRVVIADRGFQQTLGVGGRARRDHLEAREVGKDHIRRLRMGRSELPAAADRGPIPGGPIWPLNM